MPHADGAFHDEYRRHFGFVHGNLKRRAANRDHSRRRINPRRVGFAAQPVDVDLDAPEEHVDQVAQASWILADDNLRVGINKERTAVGDLQRREAVRSGDDGLAQLYGVAGE